MDWNLGWLFTGALAFGMVLVNLGRAVLGRHRGWQALLFGSLACGTLTLLQEYRMAARWVLNGDLAAVEDVVPTLSGVLTVAVGVGLFLNFAVLLLHTHEA